MSLISDKVPMDIIPEKVSEEEGIDFKQRQRRRSSVGIVHLPQIVKIRRDSVVSTTESYCKSSFISLFHGCCCGQLWVRHMICGQILVMNYTTSHFT